MIESHRNDYFKFEKSQLLGVEKKKTSGIQTGLLRLFCFSL
jgi:hypothetical protein